MRPAAVAAAVFLLLAVAWPGWSQLQGRDGARIEPETYAELENSPDGTAFVIVLLRPVTAPVTRLTQRMAEVRAVQDAVLSVMNAGEYAPAHRYKTFAGMTLSLIHI